MDEEKPDTPEKLKARALRYLVRREHSRAELARKLAPHAASPADLDAILDQLLSRKQLSDERFAEERARSLSRKFGSARIVHDLRSKGVEESIAERAASGENDLDKARAILARKYRAPARSREETAKRARFLQGRGFTYETIKRALAVDDAE